MGSKKKYKIGHAILILMFFGALFVLLNGIRAKQDNLIIAGGTFAVICFCGMWINKFICWLNHD